MNLHAKLLKTKLLWMFILFALIPMLSIALYSYYNIKDQITSSELSHLEAIAKIKSLQIERFYNRSENSVQIIQNSPYAINLLSATAHNNPAKFKEAKTIFQQLLNLYVLNNAIDEVYIIGMDGKVVVGSTKKEDDKVALTHKIAFEEGKSKIYFSDIYRGHERNESYLFTVSGPIRDTNNKLIGVVIAEFIANDFFKQLQDYSGLGMSGETLLGKKIGDHIVFLNPLRHDPDAGMKRSVKLNGPLARPVILGASGEYGSSVSLDYRGAEVLAAWRYVPKADWGMVAKIDKAEALEPLASIKNGIVATVLLLLAFGMIVSLRMTTDIVLPVDHLETETHVDALTGLSNRKQLMGALEHVLEKAREKNTLVAVMFLDLDGFKSVNDTYGHETGDLLLQKVAKRLTNCVRQGDTVARLGGDEFVVLLCGAHDLHNITKIANTIIQSLNEEYSINGAIAIIGASMGISIFPKDATTAYTILRLADEAMYEAKKAGKNNFKFIDETDNQTV